MVPRAVLCYKTPLQKFQMKNTNLLNPQVASTDKYGNDFYFFLVLRWCWNVLCREWEERMGSSYLIVKCESTDNHRMMNEWWVFCALPWSLILIKRFLVLQILRYHRRSLHLSGIAALVLQHPTMILCKWPTSYSSHSQINPILPFGSRYVRIVCNVNDKSDRTGRHQALLINQEAKELTACLLFFNPCTQWSFKIQFSVWSE